MPIVSQVLQMTMSKTNFFLEYSNEVKHEEEEVS